MNKSKIAFKRVRPLLGTFVEISLFHEMADETLVSRAFERGATLEKVFNKHDPYSDLSLYNQRQVAEPLNLELEQVIKKAEFLCELSRGYFNPRESKNGPLDLGGIAKGYIVDKMVEVITAEDPSLSGLVNAGGDLRFFNSEQKKVQVKVGAYPAPFLVELNLPKNALATSNPSYAQWHENSSTRYYSNLKKGCTVSVFADECMIADALTKVGLCADSVTLRECVRAFEAQVLIFDEAAQVIEMVE